MRVSSKSVMARGFWFKVFDSRYLAHLVESIPGIDCLRESSPVVETLWRRFPQERTNTNKVAGGRWNGRCFDGATATTSRLMPDVVRIYSKIG
jgi:hypothetical protein